MNLSELLHVTNQVRKAGELSPYLFTVYLDDLFEIKCVPVSRGESKPERPGTPFR